MPNELFLMFSAGAAAAAYFASRSETEDADDTEGEEDALTPVSGDVVTLEDVTDYSPVSLQLGYGLISLVDEDKAGPLVSRITAIRREVSKALGFVVPSVRIRDDLALPPNQYRIRIGHTIVGEDVIYPDRKLALPGEGSTVDIDGIKVRDPSFGVEAIWIRPAQQTQAEANDYVVIEPISVITTHMSQLLTKHAADLIGQDDVQAMIDNLAKRNPQLVQSIVPKLVPLHVLTEVLRLLLVERIPIADLRKILEGLSGMVPNVKSPVAMSEALRPSLVPLLIQQLASLGQTMPVITLAPDFEQLMLRTLRQSGDEGLVLDGALAKNMLQSLNEISERLVNENRPCILVVAPPIRRHLADFVRVHVPQVVILGFTELPENRTVEVVATIGDFNGLPSSQDLEKAEVN
jgi:flagellar biosynthesis protein FlhA